MKAGFCNNPLYLIALSPSLRLTPIAMADLADLLGFHCVRRFPILFGRRFEILAASFDLNARGLVLRPPFQNLLKNAYATHKIASAVGRKPKNIERHPGGSHPSAYDHV